MIISNKKVKLKNNRKKAVEKSNDREEYKHKRAA